MRVSQPCYPAGKVPCRGRPLNNATETALLPRRGSTDGDVLTKLALLHSPGSHKHGEPTPDEQQGDFIAASAAPILSISTYTISTYTVYKHLYFVFPRHLEST